MDGSHSAGGGRRWMNAAKPAGWFFSGMGFLLAMLPPGAFIAFGLLLAARNWFIQRRS